MSEFKGNCIKHDYNAKDNPEKYRSFLQKTTYKGKIYEYQRYTCLECQAIRRRDSYLKNKEHQLESSKIWHINNPEKIKALNVRKKEKIKELRINNPEAYIEFLKKSNRWRLENPELKNKNQREYRRKRKKKDIEFRILENLRTRINSVLKGISKSKRTMELLGCSLKEFKEHLSLKFKDNMTFDNYGKWHVDHIKPCSKFNLIDPLEQAICFHYTNLQPLWALDNMRKGSKF
mgnify:FL=1|tara:strand:- start:20 stop:718 length:699 start_codon:yes stop_codon:yes gene_type:complete